MQIVLTRDHVSVPWGFRLKGGAEYNVPLSILKVNEGSPSHFKLENGDVIVSIGQYPALNLKHEEALNIIRLFDVTLPLTIRRDQSSFTPPQILQQPKQSTSSLVWRPSSYNEQTVQQAPVNYAPVSPVTYDPHNYSAYAYSNNYDSFQQQQYQFQQNAHQQQAEQVSTTVNVQAMVQAQVPSVASPKSPLFNLNQNRNTNSQYRHFNFNSNTNSQQFLNRTPSQSNLSPNVLKPQQIPPPPPPPPPPAPPLPPMGFNNPHVYTPNKLVQGSNPPVQPARSFSVSNGFNLKSPPTYNRQNENRSANAHVPDVLAKALNGPPLSVKPFTYTPGGLDLSHVRESSRVKRYDPANVDFQQRAPTPSMNQAVSPSFQPSLEQQAQQYVSQSPLTVNVHHPAPPNFESFTQPLIRQNDRPVKTAQIKPAKPGNTGQPAPGFHITPQEIVRPKKREEGRDLANQSYSFRMLNKWIEDSESTKPLEMLKNDPETYTAQPTVLNVKRTDVLIAVEEEEKKQRKLQLLQRANNKQDSNASIPSKVFKFIDRKYSTDIFEYPAVNEMGAPEPVQQQAGPASQRNQELGLHKYRGAEIPSRSFKQLQIMTNTVETNQTFVANQQKQQVVQEEIKTEAPVQEVPVAEVVNNVQIEVSAETSTQQTEAQTTEAQSSFVSSNQEVINETSVNLSDASAELPAAEAQQNEPAEQQQIDAQIEAVVASIETLSQPPPQEPEPVLQAEPEPAPVAEPVAQPEEPTPEPSEPQPQPALEPEPEPTPASEPQPELQQEVPAAAIVEPEPVPTPAPEPEPEPQPEPQPSQIEQTVSNDQAQDKNETSDF